MTDLITTAAEPRRVDQSRAPLLIMLHGFGSHENDLMGLAEFIDPRYRVVSVRAPVPLEMGGYAWFPIEFSPVGMVMDIDEGMRSRDHLLDLVQRLQATHGNDGSDTIALGFSQGGAMALSLLLAKPNQLAGVAFLSGVWLRELLPEDDTILTALQDKPVLQTHGTDDPLLHISGGEDIAANIPNSEYHAIVGMGHETPASLATNLSDLIGDFARRADGG